MSTLRTYTNHLRVFSTPIFYTILISSLFSLRAWAGSGCFYPNGTENPHSTVYEPCNPNARASMCCAIGKNRLNKDQCLDSGLCLGDPFEARIYWRESCTDPTWRSPECVNLCTGPQWEDRGDAWLTVCEDGKFCCGRPSTLVAQNCCKNNQGFYYNTTMPNALQVALVAEKEAEAIASAATTTTEASSSSQATATSASSTTSALTLPTLALPGEKPLSTSITPSSSTTKAKKSPLEGGVIAGIVIAGLVAIALVAWAALLIARRRKTELHESSRGIDSTTPVYVSHQRLRGGHRHHYYHNNRVNVNQPIQELPDRRYTVRELEGDPGYKEKTHTRDGSEDVLTGDSAAESLRDGERFSRKM